MSIQDTTTKVEIPPEFRALTLLDNAPKAKPRPQWQDPVRWCLWGDAAIFVINVAFTVAAVGVPASQPGESLDFGSITLF